MEQINIHVKDKSMSVIKISFRIIAIITAIVVLCTVVKDIGRNEARSFVKFQTSGYRK